MPWKNAGGETMEIAVSPAGAGLDDFDWRVSTARVASDGPFSRFPGIDRTLAVLGGEGLRLSIGGKTPVLLTSRSEPFAFAGDVDVDAALIGGEIADLNVTTRRDRFSHRVSRIEVAGLTTLETTGAETLVYCFRGEARVHTPAGSAFLSRADALSSSGKGVWRLLSDGAALVYVIEFFDLASLGR
jgi:environmental stress-induced protein Ves